jgi:DNA-binding Lrp family transcriptional regulator
LVESMISALSTDTVRLEEQYAADEQRILKDLDSMNIKIFSAMWKLGPRNLLEVSRHTGIPFTSVYHRIERLESKAEGPLAHIIPKVSKLGMMRVVVPVLKGGLWCMDKVGHVKRRFAFKESEK